MNIEYTRHVRRRMKWRKISETEIEMALTSPDKAEPTEKDCLNVYKSINNRTLKETFS